MSEPPVKNPKPLEPGYVPENLEYREDVQETLKEALSEDKGPQNLFIYGPHGTGKTHLIHHTLKNTDRTCYITCTEANTQYKALTTILERLGYDMGTGHHTSDLQRKIIEETRAVQTIIILDDIEFLLMNGGDDLIYFLTRMETQANIDLIIASSNYTDLKPHIEERTYSSLQPRKIRLQPYSIEQTYQILVERARKALTPQSLQKSALTHITFTTQNITAGLTWLKHTAKTTDNVITESQVQQNQDQIQQEYATYLLKQFTEDHLLLYQAIQGLDDEKQDIRTGEIYTRYQKLCNEYDEETLSKRRLSDYLKHLELLNLVNAKYHYGGSHGKTREIEIVKL